MKKPLSIILIFLLIISLAGNITLYLQLNKVNSENRNFNNSIVETQDLISELENQLSDLQQQLSDSTAKNEELQENNDSLQSELEQLKLEMEKLQSEKSLLSEENEASLLSDTKPISPANTGSSSDNSTSTTNNNNSSNTTSSNQGNTSGTTSSSSFNQDNVGDILNSMFGEGGSATGYGNGQGMRGDY